MTFVCLWSPHWSTAAAPLADLAVLLLSEVPRVAVDARGALWADVRGLPAPRVAWALQRRAAEAAQGGASVRAGVAAVPVAAEVAARSGEAPVSFVEPGHERAFLSSRPVELLSPDAKLLSLLNGVGIHTCGELARLSREAVEVRFGAAGAALWRLSRADDPRLLFGPIPREPAAAALEFVDYVVTDAGRLVFAANGLLGSVCDTLSSRAERARRLTLTLALADDTAAVRTLGAARPTAERAVWLRRLREVLDALVLESPVTGIRLAADATEPVGASQGDLFDRGFASASAVEEAVSRVVDTHGPLFVRPETRPHPLPEARTTWRPVEMERLAAAGRSPSPELLPALRLQLLPHPRRVAVRVRLRRDHALPFRYRERGGWRELVAAAGPDRVSGGHAEASPYAREYWRCETDDGRLVWLFRDAVENAWYLHGWWE